MRAADWIVDIGPGPGRHGGMLVAQGDLNAIAAHPTSLTGEYLSGRRKIEIPATRRKVSPTKAIVVKGANANNLQSVDAAFPLGGIVCVTGVSGSGKSTLVNDTLFLLAARELNGASAEPAPEVAVYSNDGQQKRVISAPPPGTAAPAPATPAP
jgi:excinuclease ABC subunit A